MSKLHRLSRVVTTAAAATLVTWAALVVVAGTLETGGGDCPFFPTALDLARYFVWIPGLACSLLAGFLFWLLGAGRRGGGGGRSGHEVQLRSKAPTRIERSFEKRPTRVERLEPPRRFWTVSIPGRWEWGRARAECFPNVASL